MNYKFKIVRTGLKIPSNKLQQSQYLSSHSSWGRKFFAVLFFAVIITVLFPLYSFSFSLFVHEAIIDMEWEKSIQPLLKIKYPMATDSELVVAHSYVFGGAIISDIGYYPFGSVFFTHLLHYVYTGDFINALIDEAKDVNEYAFALGVLSHYYLDKYGHPMCTNHAVPLLFPELKQKYGDLITFEQGEKEHARVEFGLDVIQTAMGNYKPNSYHDYIGFRVSEEVLEKAFLKTYNIELKSIFTSLPMAIELLRFTVSNIIPELTRDAWRIRSSFITDLNPLADKDNYVYKIDKTAYEKEFGKIPIKSWVFSFFIWLTPTVGPFDVFNFKEPSPEVELLYKRAMGVILKHYSAHLRGLKHRRQRLENINFDTGKKTVRNDYKIADETYEELLEKQKDK